MTTAGRCTTYNLNLIIEFCLSQLKVTTRNNVNETLKIYGDSKAQVCYIVEYNIINSVNNFIDGTFV